MEAKIKNLEKVAKRIKRATKNKEKIILYGDADLDGISSVIILKEAIKNLGGSVFSVYFPDRETEGYGLNEKALKFLEKEAPALLFLLDCGISNFLEIEEATKIGFEVIVIDHHEILDKLPKASIIVDPKQEKDNYSSKGLATAGILYKLSQLLLLKNKSSQSLKDSFLELVALSTLADMMPKTDENKIFIEQGLCSLEKTFRPGLQTFFEIEAMKDNDNQKLASKMIASLNAGKNQDHLNESYLLLTTVNLEKARQLAKTLLQRSLFRKERIKEITEEAEERIVFKPDTLIIFEGDPSWSVTLLGPVASKICRIYEKPTFIYRKGEKESVGAVRVPKSLNCVKALMNCSKYLKTYGGHPLAAGFTVLNENLEKFKECLTKYFET